VRLSSGSYQVGEACVSDTELESFYVEDPYRSLRLVPSPCVHELPTPCGQQNGGEGSKRLPHC
jgi:hypothetical protein